MVVFYLCIIFLYSFYRIFQKKKHCFNIHNGDWPAYIIKTIANLFEREP
jgi:hypothetical protein